MDRDRETIEYWRLVCLANVKWISWWCLKNSVTSFMNLRNVICHSRLQPMVRAKSNVWANLAASVLYEIDGFACHFLSRFWPEGRSTVSSPSNTSIKLFKIGALRLSSLLFRQKQVSRARLSALHLSPWKTCEAAKDCHAQAFQPASYPYGNELASIQ